MMTTELDALAVRLAEAKANTLRTDAALRCARADERRADEEYRTLHAQMHPPATIEVVVPEGMRHVGWYCEHALISGESGWTYTPHRTPSYKNKRGWEESTTTVSGLDSSVGLLTKEDAEKHCQYRRPMFVVDSPKAAAK